MKKGVFYGVGIGPGDPELLTLKAVKTIENSQIILAPETKSGQSLALSIAEGAVDFSGKKIVKIAFPMVKDAAIRQKRYEAIAEEAEGYLNQGLNVSMLNLGDVSIYSTVSYILPLIKEKGFETQMIPGITSFCAVGARLQESLTSIEKPLHIVPMCHEGLEENIGLKGTKVLMKNKESIESVKKALAEAGLLEKAILVENCGLPNEKIIYDMNEAKDGGSYFTTIIVKD